jgi:mannose-6-phosphate isomerase
VGGGARAGALHRDLGGAAAPASPASRWVGALRRAVGCRGERFALERWTLSGAATAAPGEGGFVTLTNLGDAVEVEHGRGVVTLPRAASCLLPAALGEVRLIPTGDGDLVACFEPGDGA